MQRTNFELLCVGNERRRCRGERQEDEQKSQGETSSGKVWKMALSSFDFGAALVRYRCCSREAGARRGSGGAEDHYRVGCGQTHQSVASSDLAGVVGITALRVCKASTSRRCMRRIKNGTLGPRPRVEEKSGSQEQEEIQRLCAQVELLSKQQGTGKSPEQPGEPARQIVEQAGGAKEKPAAAAAGYREVCEHGSGLKEQAEGGLERRAGRN